LGILGEAQLVVARADEQVAPVDIGRGRELVAEVGSLRIREHVSSHAGLLGALAGVEECDFGHQLLTQSLHAAEA
jgi:hypothetical protein